MENIKDILGNATMAYTTMDINIDAKKVVQNVFDLLEENKENIVKANEIDVKNDNGFKIDFDIIEKMRSQISILEDMYRKVISMYKNEKNFLQGTQTDNLGNICVVYDGNTYCLLETICKAILTHNSIILTSETDYMKATNEFILILIQRVLDAYKIDKNLVQILYTSRFEELFSNSISINRVISIGDRNFQNRINKLSKAPVISKGYNHFDIYIEDLTNIKLIQKIKKENENIDIYVKNGLNVPFDDYIKVEDIDEGIAIINLNTSGYSSSIFTSDKQNATQFLRDIKAENIFVNSSPLIKEFWNIDIELLITKKNMFYPNPLKEDTGENKVEFPTQRAIIEKNKKKQTDERIEKIQEEIKIQLEQKNSEVDDLKRQLQESQNIIDKYMNIFRKSFFTRFFGKISKAELEKDTKLLSSR